MKLRIKTLHLALVGLLALLALPGLASSWNNGTITMSGNGDTWSLATEMPGLRITHITIDSAVPRGNATWHWRYGTTSTNTRIYSKTLSGTAGTTQTVEVDFANSTGGIPISATKGLYLSSTDDTTATAYLYTNLNKP